LYPNIITLRWELKLYEWWNQPPTFPLGEASQTTQILYLDAESPWILDKAENTKYEWVFNGYDVKRSSLAVPPNGVVVFEVSLLSGTWIFGGGTVDIEIRRRLFYPVSLFAVRS
jgi:hypothetical protein